MKKYLIIYLMLLVSACQPAAQKNFTLNGEINDLMEGYVYLFDRVHGLFQVIDSARVVEGRFTLKGSLDFPEYLYLDHIKEATPRIGVFLENSDMTISFTVANAREFTLTGSGSHDLLQQFNMMVAAQDAGLQLIQQQVLEAEVLENTNLATELKIRFSEAETEKKRLIRAFVDQHRSSPVAIFAAMRNLAHDMNGEELNALVDGFDIQLKDSRYYKNLRDRADKLLALAIGNAAPEFSQPNTEGAMVSLNDFRGKYLLVSFWASWCPFCRQENPHLVKVYNQYAGQNFEILGVSLDRRKEPWLKAIADDKLTWPQVSDLKGWQNEASTLYGVSSIPGNILLDSNGIILGRNLKGEELDKTLAAIFGTAKY